MNSNPVVLKKHPDTNNYHGIDINSYLISHNLVFIDGDINPVTSEIINLTLMSFHEDMPEKISIALNNVSCVEFKYVFSLYEGIKLLEKKGASIEIQINGTISDLANLIAMMNYPKYVSETSIFQFKELKTDNSFNFSETKRIQAVDLISHLDYYEKIEAKYFEIMSKEMRLDIEKIKSMHDRLTVLNREDLIELGLDLLK